MYRRRGSKRERKTERRIGGIFEREGHGRKGARREGCEEERGVDGGGARSESAREERQGDNNKFSKLEDC